MVTIAYSILRVHGDVKSYPSCCWEVIRNAPSHTLQWGSECPECMTKLARVKGGWWRREIHNKGKQNG